jgi:DNA-binding LytR/AlgR family response regulator
MYKCIIIDDEELARGLIANYVGRLDFLTVVGSFESPIQAINTLKSETIDLVFLDIQMPEIKGTDFAKMLDSDVRVIFTTAYSEYALEGFELNALDYLLKPITFTRFLAAVNKLKSVTPATNNEEFITVKSGYDLHKLKFDDIVYIESDSEYVNFHTKDKKIMSHNSLKLLTNQLPESTFIRVHRSFIVNKNKISSLKGKSLIVGDVQIPISATYSDMVREVFG